MNPLVIIGVVSIALFAAGMMVAFSAEQVRYAQTIEKTSEMQSQRMHESLHVMVEGGTLKLENSGSIPVQVREIRILDDEGHIIYQKKADHRVLQAQEMDVILDAEARRLAGVTP